MRQVLETLNTSVGVVLISDSQSGLVWYIYGL